MAYHKRSIGAHTNLQQLASYRLAAARLPVNRKSRAMRQLTGPFASAMRGRGMEFEDVRQYQPGDDIRAIDWRVTARTGQTHTKQYREEREKPVILAVDQRQTMFFGSRCAMKSVMASDIAAYLAWACYQSGDRVGGLVFNNHSHQEIRPRRHRKTILHFLQQLAEYNGQLNNLPLPSSQHWLQILPDIKRICRPGTRLFLISDFHDLNDDCAALLHDIARSCEVFAIQIHDPLEQTLPASGIYPFFDGQQKVIFDSNQHKIRQQYQQDFATHQQYLQKSLSRLGIVFMPISTEQEPLNTLHHYFGKR